MGLLQIRFEDEATAATIYSTWDDDETPDVAVNLAFMQDIFRAQEGAPFEHPGWLRALQICHSVQSEMPDATLKERYDNALGRFLELGGTTNGEATSLASLMVSFDAHYFRAYPDDRAFAASDHGTYGGEPHVIVRIAHANNGHGPETILTVVPHPDTAHHFNCDEEGYATKFWNDGRRRTAIRRRIKALAPFRSDLITIEQDPDHAPVVTVRFDAATVAAAYARVLGLPMPNRIPLHDAIRHPRSAWTLGVGAKAARAVGGGSLVVKFHSPAAPQERYPGETVTLRRKGDVRDLPDVLTRIASLPLLPMLLQPTDDRATRPYLDTAREAEEADDRSRPYVKGTPDLAVMVREAERSMSFTGPNFRRSLAGYASFVFTAEPGLWEMFPDGSDIPADSDVTVIVDRLYPSNTRGVYIFHSSSDPDPTADGPDSTHVSSRLTISPHPRHVDGLRGNPDFVRSCELLDAWKESFAPYRMRTYSRDIESCSIVTHFEQVFLASAHAWLVGLPLPATTPYGARPELPAYTREATTMPFFIPEDECLLTPEEVEEQRELSADWERRMAWKPDRLVELLDKDFDEEKEVAEG